CRPGPAHRPALEPPAGRGGTDVRPRGRDPARAADGGGDAGRAARRHQPPRARGADRGGLAGRARPQSGHGGAHRGWHAAADDGVRQRGGHQPRPGAGGAGSQRAASPDALPRRSLLRAHGRNGGDTMSGIVKAEWLKLRKRPAIRSIGVIWLVLVLLLGYLLPYLVFKKPPPGRAGARLASAALLPSLLPNNLAHWFVPTFSGLGGTLILILAALVGGSEFGWSTLKTILTQRPGRLSVFTGKLLALAVLLVLFVVRGYVVGAIGSLIVALFQHAPVTWPPASDLARSAGAMFLIFAAWTAFGLGLAILFRGTALAIGLGLAY